WGPGADQGHRPVDDVPELGKLVEGVLAQPAAEGGDPGVLADLEERPVLLVEIVEIHGVGSGAHGPELPHREAAAVQPHPDLPEEHGTGTGEPDGEREDGENRG